MNSKLIKLGFSKKVKKAGRPMIFQTPEELIAEFIAYTEWMEDNPWHEVDFRGRDLERVEIPKTLPWTIGGFCMFAGIGATYFNDMEKRTLPNMEDKELSERFSQVLSEIKKSIREQKFAGASVGVFKETLISKDLGLSEKVENINRNYNAEVSKEDVKDISKKLDEEF